MRKDVLLCRSMGPVRGRVELDAPGWLRAAICYYNLCTPSRTLFCPSYLLDVLTQPVSVVRMMIQGELIQARPRGSIDRYRYQINYTLYSYGVTDSQLRVKYMERLPSLFCVGDLLNG